MVRVILIMRTKNGKKLDTFGKVSNSERLTAVGWSVSVYGKHSERLFLRCLFAHFAYEGRKRPYTAF